MTTQREVVVGIDDAPDNEAALRWGLADARTRHSGVHLVCAYRWALSTRPLPIYDDAQAGEEHQSRRLADQLIEQEVGNARRLATDSGLDVSVDGTATDGDAVDVLIERSKDAAVVVVGARHLSAIGASLLGSVSAAVAARAHCPVVVMHGPPGLPEERPAVVVGVDATDASQAVLEFAFDHASRHDLLLHAILCWHPDFLAAAQWRVQKPPSPRARAWLSEALAGWREKFPNVDTRADVIHSHPVAGLVSQSTAQALLVVGSRGRYALVGSMLGSVSQGVLHHATCPVAVVPTGAHADADRPPAR